MKDIEIYSVFFSNISRIIEIPEERRKVFIDNTTVIFMKRGEVYVRQGEIPRELPFLCRGLMRKFYIDNEGRDFSKFFSQPNEFSGSFAAFLQQNESLFSVEALEDSILIDIPYDFFRSEIHSHLCWLQLYTMSLEKFYILKELREEQLLTGDGRSKYIQFLKDFPHLEKRLKQYHIASYLGITPVSLSRIRMELVNEGFDFDNP